MKELMVGVIMPVPEDMGAMIVKLQNVLARKKI